MRLCLVASKPTDAVTYGFLPAAARPGLEVFLVTDQPGVHAGAPAAIVGCDVRDARALIGRIAETGHLA